MHQPMNVIYDYAADFFPHLSLPQGLKLWINENDGDLLWSLAVILHTELMIGDLSVDLRSILLQSQSKLCK